MFSGLPYSEIGPVDDRMLLLEDLGENVIFIYVFIYCQHWDFLKMTKPKPEGKSGQCK